ncbi:MAG: hypothetical protein AAF563_12260 [Pseudomonadota bacterium]
MGAIFSPPKPQFRPVPEPAPAIDDAENEEVVRRQRLAAAQAKGRQSTILTGSQGVTSSAPVQVKTILGA